jgi:hypothetical protein
MVFWFPSLAQAALRQESPDHRHMFWLEGVFPAETYVLRCKDKIIWRESITSSVDHLVAAWSSDSKRIVFVSGSDRFTFGCVDVSKSSPRYFSINQEAITRLGEKLVPYSWNLPGQGNFPHDNIFELHARQTPSTFAGVYNRAASQRRCSLNFVMTLQETNGKMIPSYRFSTAEIVPW